MDKIKVMLVGSNDGRLYDIKQQLIGEDIAIVGVVRMGEGTLEKILSLRPNITVLQCADDYAEPVYLASDIYTQVPNCSVLMLCEETDDQLISQAMLAGVRRVLRLPADPGELVNMIRTAYRLDLARLQSEKPAATNLNSKVITVFGPKGGIGKTTVAVNLAVSLAQMGKRIALIDADLQFGDANAYLDVDSQNTIAELSQSRDASDINAIKRMLVLHHSGVSLLCAPKSPEYAEYVTAKNMETIISAMRPYYDAVIIDTSPTFGDSTVAAIESSDMVLVITGVDISSLRNAKTSINIFESLRQEDKLEFVINKAVKGIITVKDVQKVLERPVKNIVSYDLKTALASQNKGIPIVLGYPRTQIAKELKQLASSVLQTINATW